MLELSNISKKYGSFTALDNVSFSASKGHIYGFIGPNGAGKSTTLNIAAGILSADIGSVKIMGYDVLRSPEAARSRLGYLPEIPPLYPDMTVREYLDFIALAKLVSKNSLADELLRVMEKTSVLEYADKLIMNLSKGTCQRVGIAAAIIADPEVLILDEPTVGLDPEQIAQIRELILSLKEDRMILISSHILSEIEEICDQIIVINKGRIICNESTKSLLEKSRSERTIRMCVKASKQKVGEVLSKIDKIASFDIVKTDDKSGYSDIVIRVKGNSDVRERLYIAFSAACCSIIEIYEERPSLEKLYRDIIKRDDIARQNEGQAPKKEKASFSLLKSLFSQSIYEKNQKQSKTDNDDDDDTYRPLFR